MFKRSTNDNSNAPLFGRRFEYDGRALFKLNELQRERVAEFNTNLELGVYSTERTACPCGATEDQVVAEKDRFGLKVRNVICRSCGLIRQDPRLDEKSFAHFYDRHYRELYQGQSADQHAPLVFEAQKKVGAEYYDWIAESLASIGAEIMHHRMVLEIGCSAGGILAEFSSRGHLVKGVDYDESYARFGVSQGIDITIGGHSNLEGSFDIIILSHVFEHFLDLNASIKEIEGLLAPSGVLFVCVPGILNNTNYTHFRADLLYQLQNAHTYFFTERTLSQVFLLYGSSLKKIRSNEKVYALFARQKQNEAKLAADKITKTNEYQRVVEFINGIQNKRRYYLLMFYIKSFGVRLGLGQLKRILSRVWTPKS